nr:hypothetical protein Q903MT_gene2108 [Picea sitchensis]
MEQPDPIPMAPDQQHKEEILPDYERYPNQSDPQLHLSFQFGRSIYTLVDG